MDKFDISSYNKGRKHAICKEIFNHSYFWFLICNYKLALFYLKRLLLSVQGHIYSTSSAKLKLYRFGVYSTVFVSSKPTGISSHQAFIMLKQSFKIDYFESLQGRAPPSLLASCGLVPFVRSCRGWKYLASHCTLLRKMFNILVQNTIRELFTMVSITISLQNHQKTKSLTTEITK